VRVDRAAGSQACRRGAFVRWTHRAEDRRGGRGGRHGRDRSRAGARCAAVAAVRAEGRLACAGEPGERAAVGDADVRRVQVRLGERPRRGGGRQLYDEFHVAASGVPIFQAAVANLNPFSETKVDFKAANRGPILLISGEKDQTVPHALTYAAYRRHTKNSGVTEFVELPGRGHSLVIDNGWEQVARTALDFVHKYA